MAWSVLLSLGRSCADPAIELEGTHCQGRMSLKWPNRAKRSLSPTAEDQGKIGQIATRLANPIPGWKRSVCRSRHSPPRTGSIAAGPSPVRPAALLHRHRPAQLVDCGEPTERLSPATMARSASVPESLRPVRTHGVDLVVDEAQLPDHRRRQHERIKVGLAHAAVDRIDREGQRQPGVDDAVHLGVMRIEVDHGGEVGPFVTFGRSRSPNANAVSSVSTMWK